MSSTENVRVELSNLGHGHWKGVCGDRSFEMEERNGELWVQHRKLAVFFGYVGRQGPQNLKTLLNTCKKDGLILEKDLVMDSITNENNELCEVIWVSRKAALALAMRCSLPYAVGLARQMIDVFELWLDGRHTLRPNPPVQLELELAYAKSEIAQKNSLLEVLLADRHENGLVGKTGKARILFELKQIAACYFHPGQARTAWKSKRQWLEWRVRKAAGYYGKWVRMPGVLEGAVWNKLYELHDDAITALHLRRSAEDKQLALKVVR